jgi:serine/threonine protein kinase
VGDILEVVSSTKNTPPKFSFLIDPFCFTYFYRKYVIESLLGKGSFGVVLRCFRPDTYETFAIKLIKNSEHYARQGRTELEILKTVCFLLCFIFFKNCNIY